MTLHQAIEHVLIIGKRELSIYEIADEINQKDLFKRSDGNPVPASQILLRAKNYSDLFKIEGEKIELQNRPIQTVYYYLNLFPDFSSKILFAVFVRYCQVTDIIHQNNITTIDGPLSESKEIQDALAIAFELLGENQELRSLEKSFTEVKRLFLRSEDLPDNKETLSKLAEDIILKGRNDEDKAIKDIAQSEIVKSTGAVLSYSGISTYFSNLLGETEIKYNVIISDDRKAFEDALLLFIQGKRAVKFIHKDELGLKKFDLVINSLTNEIEQQIEDAHDLLKIGGEAILILPSTFLTAEDYKSARVRLISKDIINEIKTYTDASLKRYCVINIKNTTDNENKKVILRSINNKKNQQETVSVNNIQLTSRDAIIQFSRYSNVIKFPPSYKPISSVVKEIVSGVSYDRDYLEELGPVPYVEVKNLSDDLGHANYKLYLPVRIPSWVFVRYISTNAVLITLYGKSLKPTLKLDDSFIALGKGVVSIEPNQNIILTEYLAIQLCEDYVIRQFDSVRINNYIRLGDLENIFVNVPSLSEQEKIVREKGLSTRLNEKEKSPINEVEFLKAFKHDFGNLVGRIKERYEVVYGILMKKAGNESLSQDDLNFIIKYSNETREGFDDLSRFDKDVEDLLSGKTLSLKCKKIDLGRYLSEYASKNQDHAINIHADVTGKKYFASIDTAHFDLLLTNCIKNSIYYFKETDGSKPNLYLFIQDCDEEDHFYLNIMDDGSGFEDGFTSLEFKGKWSRGKRNKERSSSNSGWGGYLINSIVESHNGFLSVENKHEHAIWIKELNMMIKPGAWLKIKLPFYADEKTD